MKYNIAGTESNYFKFLPKEDLFSNESIDMLEVLSEFEMNGLQPLFREISDTYEKVYDLDVTVEFGKRFGTIRSKEEIDANPGPFLLPEGEINEIHPHAIRATIESDYFWTLGERQKCCKLMLAEITLYRYVSARFAAAESTVKKGTSGAAVLAAFPDPFDKFKADTDKFVIDHLEDIILMNKPPLLHSAMKGDMNWEVIKKASLDLVHPLGKDAPSIAAMSGVFVHDKRITTLPTPAC